MVEDIHLSTWRDLGNYLCSRCVGCISWREDSLETWWRRSHHDTDDT